MQSNGIGLDSMVILHCKLVSGLVEGITVNFVGNHYCSYFIIAEYMIDKTMVFSSKGFI